jgi:mono/diheme cytochrome c family protein
MIAARKISEEGIDVPGMLCRTLAFATTGTLVIYALGVGVVSAADVGAGKSAANAKCVQCHSADDWEGEGAASLESLIRDIVAGKVKHKGKLDLTPSEIADIAAYWGSGGKTR